VQGVRRILHVDLDAFFASVEVRERPELSGLPVIVGADPKRGAGRGVVTTASYEARKFGVRSAMPISQAWRLCPQGVYVPPRHELYGAVSDRVFDVLRETGAVVEAASIDEAYLDAAGVTADLAAAEDLARKIQREIEARERITASVGVAASKLVAKIATDMRKPRGLTVVPEGAEASFLAPLPARKIPGVGPKTESALAAMGVRTCGELARVAPAKLAAAFGSFGPRLAELARGIDPSPVVAVWERKSLGSETTYERDESDPARWGQTLDALCDEIAQGLRDERLLARTVTLKVRLADFTTFTRARTLTRPTAEAGVLRAAARDLLSDALSPPATVRLLGVRATHLSDAALRQATLDEWPVDVAESPWRPVVRDRSSWF